MSFWWFMENVKVICKKMCVGLKNFCINNPLNDGTAVQFLPPTDQNTPQQPIIGGGPCEKSGPSRFEAPAPSFAYLRLAPGPWPGYHGMSCFYSNFSGKRFKHRVFRLDLVDVSVEVGGFWMELWDDFELRFISLYTKKRSKSKMSKIRVFATN